MSSTIANGATNGSAPNGQQPALSAQAQQMLTGMTKERLHGMIARMQQLKASGVNESTSQEYATLVSTLKMFQQYQAMRQQQAVAMQARAAGQPQARASSTAQQPSAPSPSATAAAAAATTPAADASSTNGIVVKTENDIARSLSPANFTPEQLNALKTQIIAFKLISRNQPLPSHLQEAILAADRESEAQDAKKAEPLASATQVAAAAIASADKSTTDDASKPGSSKEGAADAAAAATSNSAAESIAEIPRPPSPKHDPSSSIYPYNAYVHPFSYIS